MTRTLLVAAAGLSLGACAATVRPPEPVVAPTGYVYPLGTPPTSTRFSQPATLYLRDQEYTRALELALEGVEQHSGNPIHYLLAGMTYLRLGDLPKSHSMFQAAQRIYPAYELEIEPQREAAWGEAFNSGLAAYGEGDVGRTIDHWRDATLMYDVRPEAHRNLAGLLTAEGRYDEAIDVYRDAIEGLERPSRTRVWSTEESTSRREAAHEMEGQLAALLVVTERYDEAEPLLRRRVERDPASREARAELAGVLSSLGRDEEAGVIYAGLLAEGGLAAAELFNLGIGLFRAGDYAAAAEAFARLTEVQPESRDAWFNRANALFAGEDWAALQQVSQRLVELDPLGRNSLLIAARARLEAGDREAAIELMERADEAPIHVGGLRLRRIGADTTVEGELSGNTAPEGSRVDLVFTFFGDRGTQLGTTRRSLEVPARGEQVPFAVTFSGRALSYHYQLVESGVPIS